MAKEDAKMPPHVSAGQLFQEIGRLPGDQAELVYAQSQAERERIMALSGDARNAAIDALKPKKEEPKAAPATPAKTKET